MRIFLTGFMGCGKTTVGRLLAERMGVEFVDLDSRIESRAGLGVREIFERHGEEFFRRLESEALAEIQEIEPAVVATGGGLPMLPANVDRLRALGRTVWLDVPFEVLRRRWSGNGWVARPLLENESQARELFDRRRTRYREADLRLEIDPDEAAEDVVSRILLLTTSCDT